MTVGPGTSLRAEGISDSMPPFRNYVLDFNTPTDPALQSRLESIDGDLRKKYGMTAEQTAVGLLDLQHPRLAMIFPDRIEYAASVAKVGILLAYFQLHPEAATNLDPQVRHELGLMAKISSNEMASKFSHEMGLRQIQQVLNSYDLYDTNHGGGIWVGKHYGAGGERIGDPIGNESHGATVRQLLRYFLWLEQGKLVSPAASKTMREIFASPDIPPDDIKFVKALDGRDVQIIRKWGTWQDWHHDCAVVTGPGRQYILVALTRHPKGDDYLVDLARAVDDLMQASDNRMNPEKLSDSQLQELVINHPFDEVERTLGLARYEYYIVPNGEAGHPVRRYFIGNRWLFLKTDPSKQVIRAFFVSYDPHAIQPPRVQPTMSNGVVVKPD